MKKITILTVASVFLLAGCSSNTQPPQSDKTEVAQIDYTTMQSRMRPEKIEIIEFHNTQRCYSCLKAEELIQKTLDTKFGEEVGAGILSFRSVDIDLPENEEIANKFQAAGLSIAINTITQGEESIKYDMDAWRLISDEEKYIAYFERKINTLLGK